MKSVLFVIVSISFVIQFSGCKKDFSPLKNPVLTISSEYTGTSEAIVKLKIERTEKPRDYELFRDDSLITSGQISDSVLYWDTKLQPNTTHRYTALLSEARHIKVNHEINTTDTTSHNFTWTIDTFGKYASMFYDVTIIDENNIWAYGEIRTDSGYCGVAHWDGVEWKLERLFWNSSNVYGIQSIWGESSDDFWVAVGSIFHWNGSVLEQRYQVLGTQKALRSAWGTDYSNLYFAGNGGNIVHYDGSSFKQMNSGTDIDLKRISGNKSGNVFITGYKNDGKSIALEYKTGKWKEKYYSNGIPNIANNDYGIFFSTWCGEKNTYFITLAGLLKVNLKNGIERLTTDSDLGVYPFAEHDIEGQAENDFIIADNRGRIVHWNGYSWSIHNEMYNLYPDKIIVYGADYNGNTVAVVGTYYSGSKGLIIIGRKY